MVWLARECLCICIWGQACVCMHVPSPITMTYNHSEGCSETHVWASEWMKGARAKLSRKFSVLIFLGTHDHYICACTFHSVFTCKVDPS